MTAAARHAAFRSLHASGCFVIPNPWDAGSARWLEAMGFPALATSSAGFAFSLGRRDHGPTLEEVLAHFRALVAAVDVPVNADFGTGYAIEPDDVAANVRRAAETGVSGVSIEDASPDPDAPLLPGPLAVERIAAARRALDAHGAGVMLIARCESFLVGPGDLAATIRRLVAFSGAGADVLFAPGVSRAEDIAAIVAAVAPKPVNVLGGPGTPTVPELAALGVRRVSVGSALARSAYGGMLAAARELLDAGTYEHLAAAPPFSEAQARMRPNA